MAEEDKVTARLAWISGDKVKTTVWDIKKTQVTIGRSDECDVTLQNPSVSRIHCILKRTDRRWKIEDNKSRNGIYISRKKLRPGKSYNLQCGDIINLGPPAEKPEAFCIYLEEERLKNDNHQQLYDNIQALKRPAELGIIASPQKKLKLSQEPINVISNTDNIPSPAMPPNLTSRPRSTTKKSHCKPVSNRLLLDIGLQWDFALEDSEKEQIKENSCTENVEVRSPHKDLQTLTTETELLKTKLDELSEQFKLLEETNSDLLNNYEEVCKKYTKQSAEKKQLKEDLKSCELKTKIAVRSELLEKFEEDLICNICTELLIKPTVLDCTHTFCLYCIKEWKKKKNECPICRHKIQTMTSILTLDNFINKTLFTLTPQQREKRRQLIQERENALEASENADEPSENEDEPSEDTDEPSTTPIMRISDNIVFSSERNGTSSLSINLPFPAYINNFNIRRIPQTVSSDNRYSLSTIYLSR